MSEGVAAMDMGDLAIDNEDIPKGGNPYVSTPGSRAISAALKGSLRAREQRDLERYGGKLVREFAPQTRPGRGFMDMPESDDGAAARNPLRQGGAERGRIEPNRDYSGEFDAYWDGFQDGSRE